MVAAVVRIHPAVLAGFRRGDREAFLSVYDACAPGMRLVVGRFFRSSFEREEAFQEVWLLVYRMAPSYDPVRGEIWPWLRTLGANRCKEILRARGRRPDPDVEWGDELLASAASDPERSIHAERIRAAVADFSAKLTAEESTVFRLSLVEERSHAEVAAATGISARRCKYLRMKLLLRAAEDPKLRGALGELGEPTGRKEP